MSKTTTIQNELTAEEIVELAVFDPNGIGIEPSNQLSEFELLTEDFITAGYFTDEAEIMAANVIEAQ
jgi:hypothetical protein